MNKKSLLKVLAVFLALGLLIGYVSTFASANNFPLPAVTIEPAVLELMEKTDEASYAHDYNWSDPLYVVEDIPVTQNVVRPLNYGNIKGTVTATGKCDVDPQAFEKATVNVYKDSVLTYTTLTDVEGRYSIAFESGTYDVEILAEGYVDFMETGVVVNVGEDTIVNAVLRLFAPCLTVVPESYYQELFPGETATQTMTLLNTGAAEANFVISERPGDGPVPFADVELILDDGSSEMGFGIVGTPQFIFVNRFTPTEDQFPFILEEVQILWESDYDVGLGHEFKVVVYQNLTGNTDPAIGSELLYQELVVVEKLDDWNYYELADPVLLEGPGDVIIGFIALEKPGNYYTPVSYDTDTVSGRSWFGWWSTEDAPADPTLPPDFAWRELSDTSYPGTWMIRGMGYAGSTDIVWLEEEPLAGVVFPDGGTEEVSLTFDATDLVWGDYFGTLVIINAPDPKITVPVQLRVKELNMQYMPLILRNFPILGQR